ncbi:bis(5'-nucleosyl)-tetraphosphatase (symmetrical) YqeK [Gloeocapsa sp. PCC 73106]|uniref:bis(5'-nucleosyl)-tetraphosphatase (symmetrical) YqeK n=1 Tax=Gloeocapsa sp. PCC 73106 TaxID=102232 RepID=UPI0002AC5577|nr:bis(5'-nucleosyl)-tetraphosphatase (symmetrical) YqeK [Gloeocapsa sp. PCC 73106]ELR96475.1 putative HD superfamily hydrolase of NAD metabolism [Gloeocapsa sp. PCC 73106]
MRERVISWLTENVSKQRLSHIIGVEQMARELARLHSLDEEKAAIAGLMHDLAKFFPPDILLEIAQTHQITIDPICLVNPHLLHADVSAIVAQQEFGIEDPEILSAISNHTLGQVNMSDLACVVFVADALEPNRGQTPELEKMRQTSRENLYQGVVQTCDYSLKYLINSWRTIHPRTVMTRNWAMSLVKQTLIQSN